MEQKEDNHKNTIDTDTNENDAIISDTTAVKKEPFFERLNKYSNLVVGIATLLLVIVTSIYIFLSWKIATETKRLADISVEQFKIRAFPVFLLEVSPPSKEDEKFKDEFKFCNKGQIAAHEMKILSLSIFRVKEGWIFFRDNAAIYKDLEKNDRITIFNFTKKLPPESCFTYKYTKKYEELFLNSLTYKLIYLRFKVPYDDKYSYETFAFILEKEQNESDKSKATYRWEALADEEKKHLIENHFQNIPTEKDITLKNEAQNFLKDFEIE